jgi:hypothetical protein
MAKKLKVEKNDFEKFEMKDGRMAWLSKSGEYYIIRYTDKDSTIEYFDLKKNYVPLAHAICEKCGDEMKSKRCGDFVQCKCGASFVDTDRWFPERGRYGGAAIIQHNINKTVKQMREKKD